MVNDKGTNRLRLEAGVVAALSALLVLYPPVYAALRSGQRGLFAYVAGDSFLYLGIAQRSATGFFTYDGVAPTNGFHPLWQWVLTLFLAGTPETGAEFPVAVAFWLSTACVCVGTALASLAIHRVTRSVLLSLLTVPGLYYLVFGATLDNQPIWDNVGGMEAGLSVFFGGIFLLVTAGHLARSELTYESLFAERGLHSLFTRLGLVLPFVVMTRLDDVFLLPALGALLWMRAPNRREALAAILRLGAPTIAVIVAYVTYNRFAAGTFLPVSGVTKAGIALPSSVWVTLATLFPPLVDLRNALGDKQSDTVSLYFATFRWVQLLAPALVAAAYIAFVRLRNRGDARRELLAALAGYIIVKAFYNFVNVNLWHQGSWYYAFTILLVTFLGALALEPAWTRARTVPVLRFAVPLSYALLVAITASRQVVEKTYLASTLGYDYWKDRDGITAQLRAADLNPKLIAFDDGITGYTLPFSTIHGFAFAADLETARALGEQRLLHHAYARGHHVLTSAEYLALDKPLSTSDEVRAFLRTSFLDANVKNELDAFDYELLYVHRATRAPFIRFRPRNPQP